MKIQVFYFSGTGNSLHVARELKQRIPEIELIPVVVTLKKDSVEVAAQMVGLVFPLHFFTIPYPVEQFIGKLNLQSVKYLFAIVTRGGSPSGVFRDVNKILSSQKKSLDAFFYIDMPNNCQCHHFETVTPEIIREVELELQQRLDHIQPIIMNNQVSLEREQRHQSFFERYFFFPIFKILSLTWGRYALNKAFYNVDKCIGCGVCKEVCPAGKITVKNGKPSWQKHIKCMFCFACINYCPVQAVQIKGFKTAALGRYHHPHINPEDICTQKGGLKK